MALCTCVVKTLCLFVVLTNVAPIANDSIQQPVTEDGLFTVMLLEILSPGVLFIMLIKLLWCQITQGEFCAQSISTYY